MQTTNQAVIEPKSITETDLAHRWGILPAILGQRRIFEKSKVPQFYKHGMQTRYWLTDIVAFEAANNIVSRVR